MRKIMLFTACLLIFSCKKVDKEPSVKANVDSKSILLDKSLVVFVSPSATKLEKLKKSMGADFFTIADDANFYYSDAISILDSLNVKYINADETTKFTYTDKNNNPVEIEKTDKNWYALLYDNDEKTYKIIDLIAFSEEYKKQFPVKNIEYVDIEDYNLSKKENYSIIKELKCDLNQDKIEDEIIVYKNNKEFNSDDEFSKKSLIVVFFGVGNNKYRKVENSNIFANDSNDFFGNLVINDNLFNVELNNEIPDQYMIDKVITFKYDNLSKCILLSKYSQILSGDKNETLFYTNKNFGKISFEEYDSNTILNKIRIIR